MTLRTRLALLVAVAVAVAVAAVSAVSYFTTRTELRHEADRTLERTALEPIGSPGPGTVIQRSTAGGPLEAGVTEQFVILAVFAPDGTSLAKGGPQVPIRQAGREVVAGTRTSALYDASVEGRHMRVLLQRVDPDGVLVAVARPLTDIDNTMHKLGLLLLAAAGLGIVVAGTVGRAVARAGLAPVDRLTDAAERVARTRDLRAEIPVTGTDEVSRLARSFNAMLGALDTSQRRQRELVSDASHELRTPLTSLRTNIDLLTRADAAAGRVLSEEDRRALLGDVRSQLEEMTHLVDDLTSVARDGEALAPTAAVDLAHVVATSVNRARRRAPSVTFVADLEECLVIGQAAMLERAITNVLDNAAKWSPGGGQVDVSLHGREIVVRDRGTGIAAEDVPHVFARFYRSPSARSMPGSGLGLAIVHDVMTAHGGTATVEPASDEAGGTVVRLGFAAAAS
ncbi:MAG: HAMP domain-containing sensor histidine kinase [Actinomycetota bacterium]